MRKRASALAVLARLGDAQLQGAAGRERGKAVTPAGAPYGSKRDPLDPRYYLSPGVFWWAYHWPGAEAQYHRCRSRCGAGYRPPPQAPDPATAKGKAWNKETGGVVLLLDEIDKAEPDLPNGLLNTLGQYRFTVPWPSGADGDSTAGVIEADPARVLVIITTNEERELPSAFVRRCFVHTLALEAGTDEVALAGYDQPLQQRYTWLIERGRLHFGEAIHPDAYLKAAKLLWQDRAQSRRYPPGLAEYIDLLKTLSELPHDQQTKRLGQIADFVLKKDADL